MNSSQDASPKSSSTSREGSAPEASPLGLGASGLKPLKKKSKRPQQQQQAPPAGLGDGLHPPPQGLGIGLSLSPAISSTGRIQIDEPDSVPADVLGNMGGMNLAGLEQLLGHGGAPSGFPGGGMAGFGMDSASTSDQPPGFLMDLGSMGSGGGAGGFGKLLSDMMPMMEGMFGGGFPGPSAARRGGGGGQRGGGGGGGQRGGGGGGESWKGFLSDEEQQQWVLAFTQDEEVQRSMATQAPFSDAYASGCMAQGRKRTKTDMSETSRLLQSGGSAADILSSATMAATSLVHRKASATGSSNLDEMDTALRSLSKEPTLCQAYMSLILRDLKERLSSDPDYTAISKAAPLQADSTGNISAAADLSSCSSRFSNIKALLA